MKQGNITLQGDFDEHPSVTILPVTGELRDAPLFRTRIQPDPTNNLQKTSEIMVDKAQSVPRERIGEVFGRISDEQMLEATRSLAVFLGVAWIYVRSGPIADVATFK